MNVYGKDKTNLDVLSEVNSQASNFLGITTIQFLPEQPADVLSGKCCSQVTFLGGDMGLADNEFLTLWLGECLLYSWPIVSTGSTYGKIDCLGVKFKDP